MAIKTETSVSHITQLQKFPEFWVQFACFAIVSLQVMRLVMHQFVGSLAKADDHIDGQQTL